MQVLLNGLTKQVSAGDVKAAQLLLNLIQQFEKPLQASQTSEELAPEDEEILASFEEQILASAGISNTPATVSHDEYDESDHV